MSSGSIIEIAISEFIASLCIVYPQPNSNRARKLLILLFNATDIAIKTSLPLFTMTGSASEFLIDPMLWCVNDFDMFYQTKDLAAPTRHHVPHYVQLPVEFHSGEVIELVWLVNTYIRECAQLCPDHVSCMVNFINMTTALKCALTSIINLKLNGTISNEVFFPWYY